MTFITNEGKQIEKIKCEKCDNTTFYLVEVEELGTRKGFTEKVILTSCEKCNEVNTRCYI